MKKTNPIIVLILLKLEQINIVPSLQYQQILEDLNTVLNTILHLKVDIQPLILKVDILPLTLKVDILPLTLKVDIQPLTLKMDIHLLK